MATPVQSVTATGVSATTITTPAFASAITVGNTLLAQGANASSRAKTATFSDSKANTWTTDAFADDHLGANNPVISACGHAPITTGGTGATVTFLYDNTTSTGYQLTAQEWAGTLTLDKAATVTAASSTTTITATTAATTNANDLVTCAFVGDTNTTAVGQSNPPKVNGSTTGVTTLENVSATTVLAFGSAYATVSSTGTQAVNYTYSSDASGGYALAVAVYQLPGVADVLMAQIQL